MDVLTREQTENYERDGCLLVSGLIPPNVGASAEAAMWRCMEASPEDPELWKRIKRNFQTFDSPELLACYTPEYCRAATILAGDSEAFRPPSRAFAINTFPSEGEWTWPAPHVDHAIKDHGHKVFPRAFRIAAMTFLSDVPPHGGGTIVWPGGHRKLRALAESDPERYELMYDLNNDLGRADLGPPVELTPRRGDVLFYHYLCPHSGSKNTSPYPRLALNMKW